MLQILATAILWSVQANVPDGINSLVFIDPATDKTRKVALPNGVLLKRVERLENGSEAELLVQFVASVNPSSPSPGLLEWHFYDKDGNTPYVVLYAIQGTVTHPKIGKLHYREAVMVDSSGKLARFKPILRKTGLRLPFPKGTESMNWDLVTRWRPSDLSTRFSPSSVWNTVASFKTSRQAKMVGIPSFLGFARELPRN